MTLPKFIPTVLSVRPDPAVMAQTSQPTTPPQAPPQSLDPVSMFAILLSGATAVFAIAPRLIEKWFGTAIEARQSKNDLHTLITKSQAELELDEKRKELESANELSNFYLESAREGRKSEKELLMLFVTKELDRAAQASEDLGVLIENQKAIVARLESIEKHLRDNDSNIKDIFAFLKMKDRSNHGD